MRTILVNGLKSKTGGGRSILHSYLTLLHGDRSDARFLVLTPDYEEFSGYERDLLTIVRTPDRLDHQAAFPALYYHFFPKLIDRERIDTILNFGDIPIPSNVRQVYLFDWPYAIYPESPAWTRMRAAERVQRRLKAAVLRRFLRFPEFVIAQTLTAKARLERIFALSNVVHVPNPVSIDGLEGSGDLHLDPSEGRRRLLSFTHYYSHKNLEILIPLGRRIEREGLDIVILTTIAAEQGRAACRFLRNVREQNLGKIIVNIGPVGREDIPSLYSQVDALLMPTLLESFSGTYVEAMAHGVPIATSDLDFARDVCGETPYYFDPHSVDSILGAVKDLLNGEEEREKRVAAGFARVGAMPKWPAVFQRYHALMGLSHRSVG